MFCILNWTDVINHIDLSLVLNEDGTAKLFESEQEAIDFANLELNGRFEIAKID